MPPQEWVRESVITGTTSPVEIAAGVAAIQLTLPESIGSSSHVEGGKHGGVRITATDSGLAKRLAVQSLAGNHYQ